MARQYLYNDDDRPRWGLDDPRPQQRQDGFAEARLSREIEDLGRTSGREISEHIPTNFLPPELRLTKTETPEMRAEVRRRMMANRPDRATEIRQKAALSQAIGREQTVSGSHLTGVRQLRPEGYGPVVSRDAAGRLRFDWERIGEGHEPNEPEVTHYGRPLREVEIEPRQ